MNKHEKKAEIFYSYEKIVTSDRQKQTIQAIPRQQSASTKQPLQNQNDSQV